MIINTRTEMSDDQRNLLARLITPNHPKRLATRKEVNAFIYGCLAGLDELEDSPVAPLPVRSKAQLLDLVHRAREEDHEVLRGKSDSFVIGWCKVKYSQELRT